MSTEFINSLIPVTYTTLVSVVESNKNRYIFYFVVQSDIIFIRKTCC